MLSCIEAADFTLTSLEIGICIIGRASWLNLLLGT